MSRKKADGSPGKKPLLPLPPVLLDFETLAFTHDVILHGDSVKQRGPFPAGTELLCSLMKCFLEEDVKEKKIPDWLSPSKFIVFFFSHENTFLLELKPVSCCVSLGFACCFSCVFDVSFLFFSFSLPFPSSFLTVGTSPE